MKYHILLRGLFFLSLGTVSPLCGGSAYSANTPSHSLFHSMLFHDSSGQRWTLQQWAQTNNKPIMVVAWAKWCGPCMKEMPYVQKMRTVMAQHLDVLPIAIEPPAQGTQYALPNIRMPLFYSHNLSSMMGRLNMNGIPAILIYSADGRLLHKETGAKDWSEESNILFLKNLLTKRKVHNP